MRYLVVVGLFILSMITFIDRACIATAKEPISHDLALSDAAMGMVFGAFALGYALAQIPSGWLADRFGPRSVLALVVFAWSALTAATGLAWNFSSLVAIRFLFGVGEALAGSGAYCREGRRPARLVPVSRFSVDDGSVLRQQFHLLHLPFVDAAVSEKAISSG